MEPMTPVERKIVHEALKDDPEVETASEGSEPNRFVVVVPARPRGLTCPRHSSSAGSRRWSQRPGATGFRDRRKARGRVLLDDALRARALVERSRGR